MFNKDFEHVKRVVILAALIIAVFLAARFFLVPGSFYQFGYYRGDSVFENMNFPQKFAGKRSCAACHEKNSETLKTNSHKNISCETCHGPLLKHTEDPSSLAPQKPKERKHCLLCHEKNISRPKFQKTISSKEHNPGMLCIECHAPHAPKI